MGCFSAGYYRGQLGPDPVGNALRNHIENTSKLSSQGWESEALFPTDACLPLSEVVPRTFILGLFQAVPAQWLGELLWLQRKKSKSEEVSSHLCWEADSV